MERPTNPLTRRQRRLVQANANLDGEQCPHPDCEQDVDACDVARDGTLYVMHPGDRVGLNSRSPRGETDGCRVPANADPTC